MDTLLGVVSLDQIISALVLVGVRVGSVLMFPPFLGGSAIPLAMKAGLTLALTALLWPVTGVVAVNSGVAGWTRAAAGEMAVGLLLGLAMQFIFEAAEFAGQIAGVQTGFSLITILDPQTQADTPVLALFQQLIVLLIFFQLNVHHWLLRGLAKSFSYLPPGGALIHGAVASELARAAGGIWLIGLEIAAPVIMATMVADVALGFLGKASPQLPVVLVGLSVKNILGLVVLAGSLSWWPQTFERHFTAALALGERLLHLAK